MFLKFFDTKDSVSFFLCFKNILITFNDNVHVVISNVYNAFMGILWFFFYCEDKKHYMNIYKYEHLIKWILLDVRVQKIFKVVNLN